MKILHTIPAYEPAWECGGPVVSTSQLCRALAKAGVDVTVYTTDANGKGGHINVPLNEPVDLGSVKVWYFRSDFGRVGFYSKGLAEKLSKTIYNFDLVHMSATWHWIQVDVYKACKSFSKPYAISPRGSFSPWPWKQKFIKKMIYWHLFGKRVITNATALHFTAEDERIRTFSTIPLLAKIPSFIVPNGIDFVNVTRKSDMRKNLNIPEDKFVILFIGRIHRKKGIHLVLEALKKLNDKKFIFLVLGYREDVGYVKYLTKFSNKFKDRIIWHEPVAQDEIWDFYYAATLFILPSYDENFGMAMVEAMACGLPVLISKNVCIWREVQADNAGFVVNQDVTEIANILENLSKDSDILKQMSQNAKKSAENRYDINKVASLMINAYEDILNGRKNPELQWK